MPMINAGVCVPGGRECAPASLPFLPPSVPPSPLLVCRSVLPPSLTPLLADLPSLSSLLSLPSSFPTLSLSLPHSPASPLLPPDCLPSLLYCSTASSSFSPSHSRMPVSLSVFTSLSPCHPVCLRSSLLRLSSIPHPSACLRPSPTHHKALSY